MDFYPRGICVADVNTSIVILLGPPGSGKGTVSERLKADGYVHVSTGDILRAAVKAGRPEGLEAESYMKRGELVPDEVMIRIIRQAFNSGRDMSRCLLDGFPRTVPQAERLEQMLADLGRSVAKVLFLECPEAALVERLSGRRLCRQCGAGYHVKFIPPRKADVCDACGGELYQRADDREETIRNRLGVYNRQTECLVAWYEKKALLVRIDGRNAPDRVAGDVLAVLAKAG